MVRPETRSFPASFGASDTSGSGKNSGLRSLIHHLLVKGLSYWLQSCQGHQTSLSCQQGHPFPAGILPSTLHMDQTLLSLLLQLPGTRHCPGEKIPCREKERVRDWISASVMQRSPVQHFQEFHVHCHHTFLEEQVHVDGGQVLFIHGDPELGVLHQGTVQPELLGKEQLLQAGPHVP